MKKAQSHILIYIISLLIITLIIFFSLKQAENINKKRNQFEILNFKTTLQNIITKQKYASYNSIAEKNIFCPSETELICFVDREKPFNEFTNIKLSSDIQVYKDKNTFFYPKNILPINLEGFSLKENPLCVKKQGNSINLKFINKGNTTLISSTSKIIECTNLIYNGNPKQKIDIVFLGYNYKNKEKFFSDTNYYINNIFLKTKPFSENKDLFNFYLVDNSDLICTISQGFIRCDDFKLKKTASNCPNDFIIVLFNRAKMLDSINPIRSSAIANVAKINTADRPLVLMHEFGHIFGKLADEYVDESYYTGIFIVNDYPNCDYPSCNKLKNKQGCFQGCSLNQYFRGTEKSIMRDYYKTDEYGSVDDFILSKKMEVYK